MGESNRNLLRRIWMKLFLCSHFSSVGSLIKEEIDIWVGVADNGLFGGDYNSLFGGTSSMGL